MALVGPSDRLRIHETARIDPYTVFDTTNGPIILGPNVWVQPFTRIEGPCSIAADTQLFRANLRGCVTIGPTCRIGGEVEASIVHGYSNKYHEGFLGHAYVGEWVNLGAITSNSDLRNDYGEVHVPLQGDPIPTGQAKVGCFIGDHTRTGMGSMLNTGTSIGVMCNVLPAGILLPKHVPSFIAVCTAVSPPASRSTNSSRPPDRYGPPRQGLRRGRTALPGPLRSDPAGARARLPARRRAPGRLLAGRAGRAAGPDPGRPLTRGTPSDRRATRLRLTDGGRRACFAPTHLAAGLASHLRVWALRSSIAIPSIDVRALSLPTRGPGCTIARGNPTAPGLPAAPGFAGSARSDRQPRHRSGPIGPASPGVRLPVGSVRRSPFTS